MSAELRVVGRAELAELSEAARQAPRLRKNLNLHASDQSACHRLFNAIEPLSYIRPHRHLHPEKDEAFVLISGSLGVVTFDQGGAVAGKVLLSAAGDVVADIPHGEWHTAVSLEAGTVFFEAKAGPYLPLADEEKASFAPEEGSPAAAEYLERLRRLFE